MTIEYFAERNPGRPTPQRSVATKAGGFVFVGGQVSRDEDGSIMTSEARYWPRSWYLYPR
jgi:enamine deaminase RidA (YjgF/YER057c/UK114 family)